MSDTNLTKYELEKQDNTYFMKTFCIIFERAAKRLDIPKHGLLHMRYEHYNYLQVIVCFELWLNNAKCDFNQLFYWLILSNSNSRLTIINNK